jgi:uncharacterized protein YjiS (DUF1127 family)
MRDYVLHQAQFSGSLPGNGVLARLWSNWRARKVVTQLELLNDHMLRDIGVTRAELARALDQPLTVNALLALEELSNNRWRST